MTSPGALQTLGADRSSRRDTNALPPCFPTLQPAKATLPSPPFLTNMISVRPRFLPPRHADIPSSPGRHVFLSYTLCICAHLPLDPRILQDVQRALKLKARREASLKRHSMGGPRQELVSSTDYPMKGTGAFLPMATNLDYFASSDIDFGPSVGSSSVTDGHPVPSSSDNGATLDWSGVSSDGEKRWSLTIRRKGKDAAPHLNILVQQQDKVYSGKTGVRSEIFQLIVSQKSSIKYEGKRAAPLCKKHISQKISSQGAMPF